VRRRHGSPGRPDDPPERLLRFDPADYPAAETPMGAYRRWAAEVRAWAADRGSAKSVTCGLTCGDGKQRPGSGP
jgi:hypothetical protein